MKAIETSYLSKRFRTKIKGAGFGASLRGLIRPEYRDVVAVSGISFTVEEGEIVAFIGPNGAGKSTTIKMLTGILHPTSGQIRVLGYDPVTRAGPFIASARYPGRNPSLVPPSAMDSFTAGRIYEVEPAFSAGGSRLTEIFRSEICHNAVRKLSWERDAREIARRCCTGPPPFLDEPTSVGRGGQAAHPELIRELNQERARRSF
jgi:ABC-2 type transport system ATP-binding protein